MSINSVTSSSSAQMINFSSLPPDVYSLIMLQLPVQDVVAMKPTCRTFKQLTERESLWTLLFKRDFPKKPVLPNISFEVQYRKRYCIEKNWRKGNFRHQKISLGIWPRNIIVTNDRFVFEDDGESIYIIDKHNFSLLHKLNRQCSCFYLYQVVGNTIISCARYPNKTVIEMWDLTTGQSFCEVENPDCFPSYDGIDNYSISGDYFIFHKNNEIRSIKDGSIVRSFPQIQTRSVSSIIDEDLVIFGLTNGNIEIYSLIDGSYVQTLESHERSGRIVCLKADEQSYVYVHEDKTITILDKKTKTSIQVKVPTWYESINLVLDEDHFFLIIGEESRRYYYREFYRYNKISGSLIYDKAFEPGPLFDRERLVGLEISDNKFKILNKQDGSLLQELPEAIPQMALDFYMDGSRLISMSRSEKVYDSKFSVWDMANWKLLFSVEDGGGGFIVIDEDRIISTDDDDNIEIWDFT